METGEEAAYHVDPEPRQAPEESAAARSLPSVLHCGKHRDSINRLRDSVLPVGLGGDPRAGLLMDDRTGRGVVGLLLFEPGRQRRGRGLILIGWRGGRARAAAVEERCRVEVGVGVLVGPVRGGRLLAPLLGGPELLLEPLHRLHELVLRHSEETGKGPRELSGVKKRGALCQADGSVLKAAQGRKEQDGKGFCPLPAGN